MLVEKVGGNAGGVRGDIVAVGNGVSVGSGVGVIMPAMAVCTACVITKFMSGVGEADAAGPQAVKITASRPMVRKRREGRNMGSIVPIIQVRRGFETSAERSFYSSLSPLM